MDVTTLRENSYKGLLKKYKKLGKKSIKLACKNGEYSTKCPIPFNEFTIENKNYRVGLKLIRDLIIYFKSIGVRVGMTADTVDGGINLFWNEEEEE